jgi:hypothetical protein
LQVFHLFSQYVINVSSRCFKTDQVLLLGTHTVGVQARVVEGARAVSMWRQEERATVGRRGPHVDAQNGVQARSEPPDASTAEIKWPILFSTYNPVCLSYFSAIKPYFPLTTFQYKYQRKPNFIIVKQISQTDK